jgi:glycosyltransferase involved in cell wall biosynthesis
LSSFAAGAISRATGREVLAVPAVVDFASLPPAASPAEAGLDPERCTFLYVFDANSSLERKNPSAAIEAFRRAFGPGDRVELLLKASHGGRLEHRRQLARLESQAAATGLKVRFETRHLSRRDLMRLVSASGAYLSLHRAEGFGYTCAEAMAYGVPVIATGYSGNLDFMDRDTAYLVDYREVEVEVPDGPFQRGSVWAEPDTLHAASLMRQVYENREAARELGARGSAYVREKLAIERVAAIVSRALA